MSWTLEHPGRWRTAGFCSFINCRRSLHISASRFGADCRTLGAIRKLVNQWASDHCHTLAGGTPVLALDMYEHSYHINFGAKAANYVDTFMDVIRWNNVERLFFQATGV
jgi:superoxide dismutase